MHEAIYRLGSLAVGPKPTLDIINECSCRAHIADVRRRRKTMYLVNSYFAYEVAIATCELKDRIMRFASAAISITDLGRQFVVRVK